MMGRRGADIGREHQQVPLATTHTHTVRPLELRVFATGHFIDLSDICYRFPTMAFLTATFLLRILSLFHLTCAYYLLLSPPTLSDHNLVYILGASMDFAISPSSLSLPSPALALAALFLALLGIADLTATGLDEEVANHYWSSQAPIRLAFFFGVTGYSYLWKEGGVIGGTRNGKGELRGLLCNSFVFTWGFVEMMGLFWVSQNLIVPRFG